MLHILGLVAILAVWDYSQQAKTANYDYKFRDYPASVNDRYGDQIAWLASAVQTGLAGVNMGLIMLSEPGVLEKIGLDALSAVVPEQETVIALAPVTVAAVRTGSAPDSSLLPRARVLP